MSHDCKTCHGIRNFLIGFDQWANTWFGGDPQETISSRAGKAQRKGRRWAKVLCWGLRRLGKRKSWRLMRLSPLRADSQRLSWQETRRRRLRTWGHMHFGVLGEKTARGPARLAPYEKNIFQMRYRSAHIDVDPNFAGSDNRHAAKRPSSAAEVFQLQST